MATVNINTTLEATPKLSPSILENYVTKEELAGKNYVTDVTGDGIYVRKKGDWIPDENTSGSGKLYMHSLTCSDYQNTGYTVYISVYSTKQEEFTLDYIKANPTCLKGAISVAVNDNGDASFDRVISGISVSDSGAPFDFSISTYGAAPIARQLNFTSDDVTEL